MHTAFSWCFLISRCQGQQCQCGKDVLPQNNSHTWLRNSYHTEGVSAGEQHTFLSLGNFPKGQSWCVHGHFIYGAKGKVVRTSSLDWKLWGCGREGSPVSSSSRKFIITRSRSAWNLHITQNPEKKIQRSVLIKQRAHKNGFSFIRALTILWIYPQSQVLLILQILILVTISTAGFWTKEYYTVHNETLLQKWRMHPGKVSMW